jgi:hypothetical protein
MKLMICWVPLVLVFLISGLRLHAAPKPPPKLAPSYIMEDKNANKFQVIKDPKLQQKFGADLVRFMRALRPVKAINAEGKLRIRPPRGKRREVPVKFRTFVIGPALINEYATPLGTLKVTRQPGQATEYLWTPPAPAKAQKLNGRQAEQPFAGSDFWMADLGLEMLQWPNQSVIERKLRRGELCSVLVSVPAQVGKYSKIISYVDEDTMGIVHADVFDAKGKLLKEFAPKTFKKINGQWQLKEMEMRNEQANSRTSIIFDLK